MTMIRKTSGRAFVLGLFLSLASLTAMAIDIDVAHARGEGGASGGGSGSGGGGDSGGAGDEQTYDTNYNSPRPSLDALRKKRDKDHEAQGLSVVGDPETPWDEPPVHEPPVHEPPVHDPPVSLRFPDI